ncbi:hypothetical protein JYQ62_04390 [Nostoc sp. UHCC 0702]|nr:hypothetical protein JYQ62_04390 [Nostoc sp. UHCC 0702]
MFVENATYLPVYSEAHPSGLACNISKHLGGEMGDGEQGSRGAGGMREMNEGMRGRRE